LKQNKHLADSHVSLVRVVQWLWVSCSAEVWLVHAGADLPSGKHIKKYGKSQFLMGKLTIKGNFQ
jgi:hypothetical protein